MATNMLWPTSTSVGTVSNMCIVIVVSEDMWKLVCIVKGCRTYSTCHKKLYEIRRILQKICVDSIKLPCSYPRHCNTTSAESVSHFCRMILRCPQICPYPVIVFVLGGMSRLYTNMAHKLRTGSYVRALNTMQSM